MSQLLKEQKVNITRAQVGTTRDKKAVCLFTVSISSLGQLKQVISTLEGVPGVIMVERVQKKYPTMRNFHTRENGDFVLEEVT